MTNTDMILAHIRANPGLTDAELVQRTGVRPHQQVNAICNRLQSRGLTRRAVGSVGAIVNVPADGSPRPTRPSGPERSPHPPSVANSSSALSDIPRRAPASTVLVIPCPG